MEKGHIQPLSNQNFFFGGLTLSLYSMFPKSTHDTFSQKLYQTFKDNKRFIKPKLTRSDFTIVHYAGEVGLVIVFCSEMHRLYCGFH